MNSITSKACIGTAHFGMPYGLFRAEEHLDKSSVQSILETALKFNILELDTAPSYGIAESLLGSTKLLASFSIHTKVSLQSYPGSSLNIHSFLDTQLANTFRSLHVSSVESLLVHNINDLRSDFGKEFLGWLNTQKQLGTVNKIGLSVYDPTDLSFLDLEKIDIIQLPASLYDQRFLDLDILRYFRALGGLIYARSIFLQGLILQDAINWPAWIPYTLREHHKSFFRFSDSVGFSPYLLAAGFVTNHALIDKVIFGIRSLQDLNDIACIESLPRADQFQYGSWHINDRRLTDPRLWPR